MAYLTGRQAERSIGATYMIFAWLLHKLPHPASKNMACMPSKAGCGTTRICVNTERITGMLIRAGFDGLNVKYEVLV